MRFKIKPKKVPAPKEIRKTVKFAWFPIVIHMHWVWLEKYVLIETYANVRKTIFGHSGKSYFVCVDDWREIEKQLL